MSSNLTWLNTQLENARNERDAANDDKNQYNYWADQVNFFKRQIEQVKESNKIFHELQSIEERIGNLYKQEKELRGGVTVACEAIREAHEHAQRAKTAITFIWKE